MNLLDRRALVAFNIISEFGDLAFRRFITYETPMMDDIYHKTPSYERLARFERWFMRNGVLRVSS